MADEHSPIIMIHLHYVGTTEVLVTLQFNNLSNGNGKKGLSYVDI